MNMINLVSTYRFQLHKEFTFDDLERIIPYLVQLGIGTVYASPIFESVPGSQHGYDGLNPNRIDPEIGTREQLLKISGSLRKANINWLQDIVPNHMAFDHRNLWLMDVLEKGNQSKYSSYFDLIRKPGDERLMVPFLGNTLEDVIRKNELNVELKNGKLYLVYFDSAWPVSIHTYPNILQAADETPPQELGKFLNDLTSINDEAEFDWEAIDSSFRNIYENKLINKYIHDCTRIINADPLLLQQVADKQLYRLCRWNETDYHINYRRFFTVNGLICMNMQNLDVFNEYHKLIKELVDNNVFQGLRVDHIDGLYNPSEYLHRLRNLAGMDIPVYVEKILEPHEFLPPGWQVQGNTGYDFLSLVNNLFTNSESEKKFTTFYKELSNDRKPVDEQIYEKKEYILETHMNGELENLYELFMELNVLEKKAFASVRGADVKKAIGAFLVHCPVYRFYGNHFPLEEEEALQVKELFQTINKLNPQLKKAITLLEKVLLIIPKDSNETVNNRIAHFYRRCMQFSGPLMAKGVEDTLMYTYHRFIGHNEVGDSPASYGISVENFHHAMAERQLHWPFSINTTSTHDTKRGEDVRARLNVLTDIPEDWFSTVLQWKEMNVSAKNETGPNDNDEYFIYQVIAGATPHDGVNADDFQVRLNEYFQKALREGKMQSNWTEPNEKYEKAVETFVARISEHGNPFLNSLTQFLHKIADHGIINSLSQLILKFTCPGIPDIYQGCELWDFSLVDPDNRRSVDYSKRAELLSQLNVPVNDLWDDRKSGKIKLWLVQQLCRLRNQNAELFVSGEYLPLKISGKYSQHVIAFARKFSQQMVVIAVPLHTAAICKKQNVSVNDIDWADTSIELPENISSAWDHVINGKHIVLKTNVSVSDLFGVLPFAVLKGKALSNERGAGILLHISSLPSPFCIGDLGPEARNFVDFLLRSRQKYWQLLPLNPIEEAQGYSPYSSVSSRAGNPLFISPHLLVQEGWISSADVESHLQPADKKADFKKAEKIKAQLLDLAWNNFIQNAARSVKNEFEAFVLKEEEWLDDFALFVVLKQLNAGKPWYEWKNEHKVRDEIKLQGVRNENEKVIQKIKWIQFVFMRQWNDLKNYCNNRGISLIGDLPFYVSYDSADVWSHPHLFALDKEGNRTGVAGVPPDAFSDDGQLWGMPVFNWDELKKENFSWWIKRLEKNKELFDIVRLDHFRAFSAYWNVPAGALTAKEGKWEEGPGDNFFRIVQKEFGELPFVAEDLGEIDEPVYILRDEFGLPGMKVLQFAFGGGIATSVHIPHNYEKNFLVYTGTHDNNTTRGWFTTEADEDSRLGLERYVGRPVSSAEVSIILARMAYASVANIVILPIQDVLNLDETARMNIPSSASDNWVWRLVPNQINEVAEENLKNWTRLYNRE